MTVKCQDGIGTYKNGSLMTPAACSWALNKIAREISIIVPIGQSPVIFNTRVVKGAIETRY